MYELMLIQPHNLCCQNRGVTNRGRAALQRRVSFQKGNRASAPVVVFPAVTENLFLYD